MHPRTRVCPLLGPAQAGSAWVSSTTVLTTILTTTLTTVTPPNTPTTAEFWPYPACSGVMLDPGSVGVRGSSPLSSTMKNPRPDGLGFFAESVRNEPFDDSFDDNVGPRTSRVVVTGSLLPVRACDERRVLAAGRRKAPAGLSKSTSENCENVLRCCRHARGVRLVDRLIE